MGHEGGGQGEESEDAGEGVVEEEEGVDGDD